MADMYDSLIDEIPTLMREIISNYLIISHHFVPADSPMPLPWRTIRSSWQATLFPLLR